MSKAIIMSEADNVATLLAGDRLCLEPAGLSRKQRVSH